MCLASPLSIHIHSCVPLSLCRIAHSSREAGVLLAELLRLGDASATPLVVGFDSETPVLWGKVPDHLLKPKVALIQLCYHPPSSRWVSSRAVMCVAHAHCQQQTRDMCRQPCLTLFALTRSLARTLCYVCVCVPPSAMFCAACLRAVAAISHRVCGQAADQGAGAPQHHQGAWVVVVVVVVWQHTPAAYSCSMQQHERNATAACNHGSS